MPPAFTNIQWKTYLIFGTFCIAMTFHIFFTYPETVRRSLEEIDELFDNNVPAWRSANVGNFEDKVAKVKRTGEVKAAASDHREEV